jgi:hypothetical protein
MILLPWRMTPLAEHSSAMLFATEKLGSSRLGFRKVKDVRALLFRWWNQYQLDLLLRDPAGGSSK